MSTIENKLFKSVEHGQVMSSVGDSSKSIVRLLQHSILQLCNEQIVYGETLQVLGVICITIDDRQQELVVKVNNTLKRVNPVTPPKEPSPDLVDHDRTDFPCATTSIVMNASQNGSVERTFSDALVMLQSQVKSRNQDSVRAGSPASSAASSTDLGRRLHGRKQQKPVKVRNVCVEEDSSSDVEVNSLEKIVSDEEQVPSTASGVDAAAVELVSQPSVRKLGGVKHLKRKLSDMFENSFGSVSSHTIRGLLTEKKSPGRCALPGGQNLDAICREVESRTNKMDRGRMHQIVEIKPEEYEDDVPEMGLNFSRCALDALKNDRAFQEQGSRPLNRLDFLLKTETGDISQNLAINSAFVEDKSLTPLRRTPHAGDGLFQSYSPGNFQSPIEALQGHYLNLLATSNRSTPPTKQMLGFHQMPPSHTMSDSLRQSLTMRLAMNDKFAKHLPSSGHAIAIKGMTSHDGMAFMQQPNQRVNVEGEFLLDSLNVEGKKRRRRTPEDALTSEEIVEYLGSHERPTGTYECKHCENVTDDLLRYFHHTLIAHNAYICHQCGRSFTTKSSLLRHRPIHTGLRRFACGICKKSFYRKDKCKTHIKRHLGMSTCTAPGGYMETNIPVN